jgi:hypothetical protein
MTSADLPKRLLTRTSGVLEGSRLISGFPVLGVSGSLQAGSAILSSTVYVKEISPMKSYDASLIIICGGALLSLVFASRFWLRSFFLSLLLSLLVCSCSPMLVLPFHSFAHCCLEDLFLCRGNHEKIIFWDCLLAYVK